MTAASDRERVGKEGEGGEERRVMESTPLLIHSPAKHEMRNEKDRGEAVNGGQVKDERERREMRK